MYKVFGKRALDLLLSILMLILTSPILLVSMLIIKLDSKGPIMFNQERVGLNGKTFRVFKLRTMKHNNERHERQVFDGNPEVTKVGAWLRRAKIDELPQLFNILMGDMSFVGPRPALRETIARLDENGHYRLKVRPGLTGLAQINGNIYLSWPERWVYDRKYVEQMSFALDLRILMKTVAIVIWGEKRFLHKIK